MRREPGSSWKDLSREWLTVPQQKLEDTIVLSCGPAWQKNDENEGEFPVQASDDRMTE